MPANKYALLRYRIIDRRIGSRQRPFPTKEALRQACEDELYGTEGAHVSLSTIEKDLYAMKHELHLGYFAPIAYSKQQGGYYYTREGYSIESLPLSDVDLEAIALAANTLSQFRGLHMFQSSEAAIEKILERFSINPRNEVGSGQQLVQFESAPVYRGGRYLAGLLSAIRERQVVHFRYSKYSGAGADSYELHPYLLREYRNRWYVVGFNPARQAVVVFALDRIVAQVQNSAEHFVPLPGFDPDTYFRHSLGITVVDAPPQRIHLRFASLSGKYVASQPLHHSQQIVHSSEQSLEVVLTLCITRELVMTVLSFGPDVEVLAPQSLREEVAASLWQMLKFYPGSTP